jgi:hypothetical protein
LGDVNYAVLLVLALTLTQVGTVRSIAKSHCCHNTILLMRSSAVGVCPETSDFPQKVVILMQFENLCTNTHMYLELTFNIFACVTLNFPVPTYQLFPMSSVLLHELRKNITDTILKLAPATGFVR